MVASAPEAEKGFRNRYVTLGNGGSVFLNKHSGPGQAPLFGIQCPLVMLSQWMEMAARPLEGVAATSECYQQIGR